MPIYYYWGEDDYRLLQAVQTLRQRVVHPDWRAFNDDHLTGDAFTTVLNQALTPVFGLGERLVWWENTPITQQCPPERLAELERTLHHLPSSTHLLFTSDHKPDGRLASTKLLKQLGTIQEFPLIPPWDQDALQTQVKDMAAQQGLTLEESALELLAAAVGSDSRRLAMELEKISLWISDQHLPPNTPIRTEQIRQVVTGSQANALQLATALRHGETEKALTLLQTLWDLNEPALKLVAVVVGQFRTWLWVKLLTKQKVKDTQVIAQRAEISNPKRVYFLQKEVAGIPSAHLLQSLDLLLQLEWDLKRGRSERESWQSTCIRIAALCGRQGTPHARR